MSIDATFEALLYGSGATIGFLLVTILCVALMMRWKPSGIFVEVILFIMFIGYFDRIEATPTLSFYMGLTGLFMIFVPIYVFFGRERLG